MVRLNVATTRTATGGDAPTRAVVDTGRAACALDTDQRTIFTDRNDAFLYAKTSVIVIVVADFVVDVAPFIGVP